MAFDVVIRPEAGCLTVVHDTANDGIEVVAIDADGTVRMLCQAGREIAVGVLTLAMSDAARLCSVAVVVRMDGPYVRSSAQARLVHS